MKITNVNIYDVQATWRRGWNPVIVRINTDEAKSGVTVAPSTPQELAKIQAEELKQWAEPVRASGFKENG